MLTFSFIDIIGHLSFGLTAVSFAMRRLVWLRVFAVASLLFGLFYNYAVGPLWLVLFWLAIFLVINLTRIVLDIIANLEIKLPYAQKKLLFSAFPTMHSRDWQKLYACAKVKKYTAGEAMLEFDEETKAITLIAKGQALETRSRSQRRRRDDTIKYRSPGTFWGELTFVIGNDQFNGSPCRITADTHGCEVIMWTYADLAELTEKNDRLRAALVDGFVRSAGLKHGLMTGQNSGSAIMRDNSKI
jgi:hypothetical protein